LMTNCSTASVCLVSMPKDRLSSPSMRICSFATLSPARRTAHGPVLSIGVQPRSGTRSRECVSRLMTLSGYVYRRSLRWSAK
jgi:hypothetical protein